MGWFEDLFIDEAKKALERHKDVDTIIASSTANSTKKFKITVDDSGILSATEIVENATE